MVLHVKYRILAAIFDSQLRQRFRFFPNQGAPLHCNSAFVTMTSIMICTLQIAGCCCLSHVADGCTR
jgi:hypothetical protein